MFIIVGSLILWKSLIKSDKNQGSDILFSVGITHSNVKQTKQTSFVVLSILVVISGFTSFILDQNWFMRMNYIYKIPIYSLLGISISFTLAFILMDMINYIAYNFQNDYSKPVISTQNQYSFILIVSCILGILYGLIFGIMDLEDLSKNYVKAAFIREQNYCIPIGLGFGCITGYMNEYIRNECEKNEYQPVDVSCDDDI